MIIAYQILACLLLIALGAFFSGSETGIYRLSRLRLRLGVEQNRPLFSMLAAVMGDSSALVISMLIGTNLASYLVTSTFIAMLLRTGQSPHSAALYATLVMAPTLFVFAEVIPKNLYYQHPDTLMPRFAPLLWFFHRLFKYSGLVAILTAISRTCSRLLNLSTDDPAEIAPAAGSHFAKIFAETRDEGLLSPTQSDIITRLVNIPSIRINSVMTPIKRTVAVNINTDKAQLAAILAEHPYTRLPVYEKSPNNITGFVNIYQAMTAVRDFSNLREFLKPIATLPPTTSVIDAINTMRTKDHKIVLVTPHRKQKQTKKHTPAGIVTMKDLVEELTGELAQW